MIKQVVTALKMVPIAEAVNIPFVTNFLNAQGAIEPNVITESAAKAMLDELARFADALHPLRTH
jgi:hypothetical protein